MARIHMKRQGRHESAAESRENRESSMVEHIESGGTALFVTYVPDGVEKTVEILNPVNLRYVYSEVNEAVWMPSETCFSMNQLRNFRRTSVESNPSEETFNQTALINAQRLAEQEARIHILEVLNARLAFLRKTEMKLAAVAIITLCIVLVISMADVYVKDNEIEKLRMSMLPGPQTAVSEIAIDCIPGEVSCVSE